ncbi:LIC11966 family surface protein [Sphingobacterium sp. LRF_L2]|uniref:LIC11966 family surface protein n=1 Tax=Sphingobacterium sp. LRF_L2 TaxID=3369421 RepID=UPI003F612868
MIKTVLASIAIFTLVSLSSCGSKKDPVEYNNAIITVINGSEKHVTDMNRAMNAADYNKAEEVRIIWEKSIHEDIKKVEDLGDFNGDDGFQKAVLNGLNGYKKIVTEDYPKLIAIRKENQLVETDEEAGLLSNINKAFENMARGVNEASDKFEKSYAK